MNGNLDLDSVLDELNLLSPEELGFVEPEVELRPLKESILGNDLRQTAVNLELVPKMFKDASFNTQDIKAVVAEQLRREKNIYKVMNFNKYEDVTCKILGTIKSGQLPEQSYLIGAPRGFGKATFANECILQLFRKGFKCVPYISLWELEQIRVDNERKMMKPYNLGVARVDPETGKTYFSTDINRAGGESGNYIYRNDAKYEAVRFMNKAPEVITGKYSFSEYINADVLFTFFSGISSKEVESKCLWQVLQLRGVKGLPTIVMMATSLDPYLNDPELRRNVWDDIRTFDEKPRCYDRVYHVSCYKKPKYSLDDNEVNKPVNELDI